MSALPVQSSVMSTLLALLFKSDGDFPRIVMQKLQVTLAAALHRNDVLTAKLILRSLAALTSTGTLPTNGSGSATQLLSLLARHCAERWPAAQRGKGEVSVVAVS